jgi:hypothetical protein
MKKIKYIILLFMLISNLFADTIKFKQGWNFLGFGNNSVNFDNDELLSSPEKIKIIWQYDNISKSWLVYSQDDDISQQIQSNNIATKSTLASGNGAWILANSDFDYTFNQSSGSNYDTTIYEGWNLLSNLENNSADLNNEVFKYNDYIWLYRDGNWHLKNNISQTVPSNINQLEGINSNEAFWIYAKNGLKSDSNQTLPYSLNTEDYYGQWECPTASQYGKIFIDSSKSIFSDFTPITSDYIKLKSPYYCDAIRLGASKIKVTANIEDITTNLARKLYDFTGIGDIAFILQNLNDESIKASGEINSNGDVVIDDLPNGDYKLEVVDKNNFDDIKLAYNNIKISNKEENLGNFKIVPKTSYNLKSEIIMDDDILYAKTAPFFEEGVLRIHNLSDVEVSNLSASISSDDNFFELSLNNSSIYDTVTDKISTLYNIDSIGSNSYIDIPIKIKFTSSITNRVLDDFDDNEKNTTINVTVNNLWNDSHKLRIHREEVYVQIKVSEGGSVFGYYMDPITNKPITISNQLSVAIPSSNTESIFMLSSSSNTKYSVYFQYNWQDYTDTKLDEPIWKNIHEPNNNEDEAKTIYYNQIITSYINSGDTDFWKLSFNKTVPYIPDQWMETYIGVAVGTKIGTIQAPIEQFSDFNKCYISGDGEEYFSIDNSGNVYIKKVLDQNAKDRYSLDLFVENDTGIRQTNIYISIDKSQSVPYISGLDININDDLSIGTVIGSIEVWEDGNSDIISFSLEGDDSSYFSIDNSGNVLLNKDLDFDKDPFSYKFSAVVTNGIGSAYSDIKIKLYPSGDTFIDKNTGLMWQNEDSEPIYKPWLEEYSINGTPYTEYPAIEYCNNLNLGGYTNWRLPTIEELRTIFDATKEESFYVIDGVRGLDGSCWTSSEISENSIYAIDFRNGYEFYQYTAAGSYSIVKCVR